MEFLIEAFLLGIIGGAIPGPILTGTFTEILSNGFMRGLKIILWALIAETAGALIVLSILYKLGLSGIAINIISIGGAIVLFGLALSVWKIKEINIGSKKILSFPKVILLTIFNSGYWIFWITVGIPKALLLGDEITGGSFIFLIIFQAAWLIATITLSFIFFKFRPLLQRKNLVVKTFKFLAIVLVVLAIKTILGII